MNRIVCLLKFGEKEHMEGLTHGEMYFSNALNFRQIEEKEMIKGQQNMYIVLYYVKMYFLKMNKSIDLFFQMMKLKKELFIPLNLNISFLLLI